MIEIKNRYTGVVILSLDIETLSSADLSSADLRGADLIDADLRGANLSSADLIDANLSSADLRNADLSSADLSSADLRNADLIDADLRGADLIGADLSSADLSYVDLSSADLSSADLRGANLRGAIGNLKEIKSLQIDKYIITYTSEIIQIGCQNHTIEQWKRFSDEQISEMDRGALDWWKKWKEILFKIIEMSPAEPTNVQQVEHQD